MRQYILYYCMECLGNGLFGGLTGTLQRWSFHYNYWSLITQTEALGNFSWRMDLIALSAVVSGRRSLWLHGPEALQKPVPDRFETGFIKHRWWLVRPVFSLRSASPGSVTWGHKASLNSLIRHQLEPITGLPLSFSSLKYSKQLQLSVCGLL